MQGLLGTELYQSGVLPPILPYTPAADAAEPDPKRWRGQGVCERGMEGPAPRVSGVRASGVWWVKNTEAPTPGHLTPVAEPAEPKSLEAGAQREASERKGWGRCSDWKAQARRGSGKAEVWQLQAKLRKRSEPGPPFSLIAHPHGYTAGQVHHGQV